MSEMVTLANLVDDAIFTSVEHQFQLAAALGRDDSFDLRVPEARITFGATGKWISSAQILGTAAPGPHTWMWAWANTMSDLPEAALRSATQVYQVGQRYAITELTTPQFPLAPQLTQALTVAAKAVTRTYYHYSCPAPGGTRIQVLLPNLGLALPPARVMQAPQILTQGLAEVSVTDHKRALRCFAALRHLTVREEPFAMHLVYPDGTATAHLDQLGRIAQVSIQ